MGLMKYVRKKVASGLYNNASEVIRGAPRQKISADERDDIKLQRLREAIEPAWQEAERGEFADYALEKSLTWVREQS